MSNSKQVRVRYLGRVQGVGFRHATYVQARSLGLTGWVRNLPDGRVEACFEGRENVIDAMLAWCHEGPGLSTVTHVDATREDVPQQHDSFEFVF